MMHCVCDVKVERKDTKIECCDCKKLYHGKCVDINDSDIDFMLKNKKVWRCKQCENVFRKLLSANMASPSTSIHKKCNDQNIQHPVNQSKVTTNENEPPQSITIELVYAEIVSLKEINQTALDRISVLEKENSTLKNKINKMEYQLNKMENVNNRNKIDIVNVPGLNKQNAVTKAVEVCSGIGVDISAENIEYCTLKTTKSGKNSDNGSTNILCVKFKSAAIRNNILEMKRKNKIKLTTHIFGTDHAMQNIYINESISFHTRQLFNEARKVKVAKQFKYLWVKDSVVLMRRGDGEAIVRIRCI